MISAIFFYFCKITETPITLRRPGPPGFGTGNGNLQESFMKNWITFLLAFILSANVFGQNSLVMPSTDPQADSCAFACMRARMDSIRQHRPTVAVVLGGGGARGMAHLGVLKYMEELGIPVDLIGGTSMGGLVSGLYALGYEEAYLDSLVKDIDWTVMMSDKVPDSFLTYKVRKNRERFSVIVPFHYEDENAMERIRRQIELEKAFDKVDTRTIDMGQEALGRIGLGIPDGLLFGFNVRNTLSSVSVGYQDSLSFQDLPIPYFCVATDMASLSEKNWTSGSLVDAMRSTMAIPFYFRPVRIDNMVLSDGGTRNNFPVDIARAMGADIVIGSEMPVNRDLTELNTLPNLAMQTITMMSSDAAKVNRKKTDILLQHELKGFNMLSFDDASIDNIISEGYETALKHKDEFEAVARLVGRHQRALSSRPATDLARHKVRVKEITTLGIAPRERKILISPFFLPKDSLYSRTDINNLVARIYGTRAFESVTYHLEGSEEPYTLVFDCQKGQTNEIGTNVHADNEEIVYINSYIGIGTRKLSGPRFLGELKIGNNAVLNMEASYKPLSSLPIVGVGLRNTYHDILYHYNGLDAMYEALHSRLDFFIEDARAVYGSARIGISTEFEPYENYIDEEEHWVGWDFRSQWHSAFANLKLDTYNDGYFPTEGVRFGVNARYMVNGYSIYLEDKDNPGTYTEGSVPRYFTGTAHFSTVITEDRLTVIPQLWAGWTNRNAGMMDFSHVLSAGGILPGRHVENQIPFFAFASRMHVYDDILASAQVDLRFRLDHKTYLTAKGAVLQNAETLHGMVSKAPEAFAFGLDLGRKSIAGPLQLGVFWCDQTHFGLNFSFGYDF